MRVEYNGSNVRAEMNESDAKDNASGHSSLARFWKEYVYVGTVCGIVSFVTAILSLITSVIFHYGTAVLDSVIGNEVAAYYTLTAVILCVILMIVSIATGILGIIACTKIKKAVGKLGMTMAITGLSTCFITILFDILFILL